MASIKWRIPRLWSSLASLALVMFGLSIHFASLHGGMLRTSAAFSDVPLNVLRQSSSRNIAIIMSDTRSLTDTDSYHHWSFLANLRYAATYSYALLYYHIIDNPSDADDAEGKKRRPACYHPKHGWRASSWCKLVAVLHALEQDFEWLVYLDSDAFFADLNVSIPEIFATYIPKEVLQSNQTFYFGGDAPYNYDKVCAGVFFVKNTPKARDLLTYWWDINSPHTNLEHPYEQEALFSDLYTDTSASRMIDAVYMSPVLQFFEKRKELPIRHLWSPVASERYVDIPQTIANQDMAQMLEGQRSKGFRLPTDKQLHRALHVIEFNATAYIAGK